MTKMIKNNKDFIKEFGKREFIEICKYVIQELLILRANKKIVKFQINNKRKQVIFYISKEENITLDMAKIFSIGLNRIDKYIGGKANG